MSFVLLVGIIMLVLRAFNVAIPVVDIGWLGVAVCFAATHAWTFNYPARTP